MYFFYIRRLDFILQLTVVVVVVGCCRSASLFFRKCCLMVSAKNQQIFACFTYLQFYALINKSSLKIDRPLPGFLLWGKGSIRFFFLNRVSSPGKGRLGSSCSTAGKLGKVSPAGHGPLWEEDDGTNPREGGKQSLL